MGIAHAPAGAGLLGRDSHLSGSVASGVVESVFHTSMSAHPDPIP